MTIIIALFIWFFGVVIWSAILVFMAMLYWIFFRALHLVFRNAGKCKGDIAKSMLYGFGYTIIYSSWIYAIITWSYYLNN